MNPVHQSHIDELSSLSVEALKEKLRQQNFRIQLRVWLILGVGGMAGFESGILQDPAHTKVVKHALNSESGLSLALLGVLLLTLVQRISIRKKIVQILSEKSLNNNMSKPFDAS